MKTSESANSGFVQNPFFERLVTYYQALSAKLRSTHAESAAFNLGSDIGTRREHVYMDLLKDHSPSGCRMFLGGYVFDEKGRQSSQMDILVVADSVLGFGYSIQDRKGFAPIDGTLAVVSVKSFLNSSALVEALDSFANLPHARPLTERELLGSHQPQNYQDWPFKIVFAYDGVSKETLEQTTRDYYAEHPDVPYYDRPNVIHVLGKSFANRPVISNEAEAGYRMIGFPIEKFREDIIWYGNDPDVLGFGIVLYNLQQLVTASRTVGFRYDLYMREILKAMSTPPSDGSSKSKS